MIRVVTAADIPRIEAHLATVPNPPSFSQSQWEAILSEPNTVLLYDTVRDISIWLRAEVPRQRINILGWMPQAAWDQNNFNKLVYILRAGLEKAVQRRPAVATWIAYGDIQGRGNTDAEREQNSLDVASFIKARISPAILLTKNPQNEHQYRIALRVSDAIAALVPLTP